MRRATAMEIDTLVALRVRFVSAVRGVDPASWTDEFHRATRAFFERGLADGTYITWMAVDGDRVVGCVGVTLIAVPPRSDDLRPFDGLVLTMWVEPDVRRRGIADALLTALLAERDAIGIRRLILHATDMARPLYESMGFRSHAEWLQLDS